MIERTPPPGVSPRPRLEADLDAKDAQFDSLRPDDKAALLNQIDNDPLLKARWDAYQAGKQAQFARAHPPVEPLPPDKEKSIREELLKRFPNCIVKTNQYAPIDCDGSGDAYGDIETDIDTSMHWHNQPLNADRVLYHVVTMDHPEWYNCLAINFLGGRMVPSVYGDEGPAYGEGSHLTMQMLGLYSSPIDGGEPSGHDMYLIPHLGAEFWKTGLEPTPENLYAFCRTQGIPGFS